MAQRVVDIPQQQGLLPQRGGFPLYAEVLPKLVILRGNPRISLPQQSALPLCLGQKLHCIRHVSQEDTPGQRPLVFPVPGKGDVGVVVPAAVLHGHLAFPSSKQGRQDRVIPGECTEVLRTLHPGEQGFKGRVHQQYLIQLIQNNHWLVDVVQIPFIVHAQSLPLFPG